MENMERARRIMGESAVCDMLLPWFKDYLMDEDVTLPRFKSAGIDFISLTVSIWQNSLAATVRHMSKVKAHIRARSDKMVFATSADEILAAKASGRLALGFHFQGVEPIDGEIELVQTFYDLGVRHMLLAYNQKNAVGDGCAERTDGGLSRYGIRLIEEMNRVGILVDGSHTGYRTTMEAMELCKAPFIFSHSNVHTLVPHYRNIRDDQIRACARSGGIIGINGVNEFLGDADASTDSLFRHVDYVAKLVGPQHVGIGLDYVRDLDSVWKWTLSNKELWPVNNGVFAPYPAHSHPEQICELACLMLSAGYAEEDVKGILGGNFLRVMQAAQSASETGKSEGVVKEAALV